MHPSKLQSLCVSLLIAYIAILLPWSGIGLTLRPDFLLLVIIFWMIRAPNLCNIGTAWGVGLLMDLASGGVFGQYALAYTIAAFFAATYQRRLVLFNYYQQLLYVFLLLLTSQISLLVLKMFTGSQPAGLQYFLPSISGVLLWHIALMMGLKTGARSRGA